MKEYMKYGLAVVVGAAVMVAYQYQPPSGQVVSEAQPVPSQSEVVEAVSARTEQSLAVVEEPSTKRELTPKNTEIFARIKSRLGVGYDPMLVFGSAKFTEEEIEAYNSQHVLPFNPVVEEVCTEAVSELETDNVIITSCNRIRERGEHPYASVPMDELEELAISDAAAALFMGQRADTYLEAARWHVRATALSGKTGPLMKFVVLGAPSAGKELVENNTPQDDFNRVYLGVSIEQLAGMLEDPRAKPENHLSWLEEEGIDSNFREITKVFAEQMLAEIRRIQAEVGVANDT